METVGRDIVDVWRDPAGFARNALTHGRSQQACGTVMLLAFAASLLSCLTGFWSGQVAAIDRFLGQTPSLLRDEIILTPILFVALLVAIRVLLWLAPPLVRHFGGDATTRAVGLMFYAWLAALVGERLADVAFHGAGAVLFGSHAGRIGFFMGQTLLMFALSVYVSAVATQVLVGLKSLAAGAWLTLLLIVVAACIMLAVGIVMVVSAQMIDPTFLVEPSGLS